MLTPESSRHRARRPDAPDVSDTVYVAGPFCYDQPGANYVRSLAHAHAPGYTYGQYYLPGPMLTVKGWFTLADHALLERMTAGDPSVKVVIDYLGLYTNVC